MKKSFILAALLAVLAWGPAAVSLADESSPAGNGDQPAMGQGMGDGMAGGGMMDGSRMDKLKEKLGLSDDQVSKLKDLFKSQGETMKPLRDQMKIDMDTLQQKVDTKASDGDVKKLLDKLEADQKEMQAGREKMKDQLRAILTPTQQAKMVLGMRKMGMGMMERWKGRHGLKKDGKDGSPAGGDGNAQPGQENGTMNN